MLEQLAVEIHLSKSALGNYERDNFKNISHYALIKLAEIFGTTVDLLIDEAKSDERSPAEQIDYLYKMEENKKK